MSARFFNLIRRACEKTGRRVAVLIDEYDKPLLQTMENGEMNDAIRKALKGFYGALKSADKWLKFALLTGVTRFSQVSVFSDLNMLRDISMDARYAGICGMSAQEIERTYRPELVELARGNSMTYDEASAELSRRYDGYHFCEDSEGVFNPFSVLSTLANGKFRYYWFQTGTPTFLVNQMKRSGFDPLRFADGVSISSRLINDYRMDGGDPAPLLYQSGYLTIKDYDSRFEVYKLGFPNEEVRFGFLNELLPYYTYMPQGREFFADEFIRDLRDRNIDGFMNRLKAFFADIPYELNDRTERHYQTVFYLVFTLMGQYARTEVHSAKGRADAVVYTDKTVYVFEFKLNGTAEDALRQIIERGYASPHGADPRETIRIGVELSKDERNITRWVSG
jgi:hypothetical protein